MNQLSIITDRERELAERLAKAEQQRDALQAKVAEQSAEIERLQSKFDLLVIERDAQAVLISDQQADVEKQTEISNNFAAQVRRQNETISSLRAEVDHRQSLLRESNRNCAEHAGVVWTQNVTIAQQAERIAELERSLSVAINSGIDRLSEQAALIEKCEKDAARYQWMRSRDLDAIVEGGVFAGKVPDNIVLNGDDLDAAIDAAIAAQKGGA